jgi:Leucine-rich repeat (LRR) protein
LHLGNNSISGQIPLSLENCTNLEFLHLAENHLAGNIPTWIGESLSKTKVIILRSNNFNGSIPEEICRLASLQILDLAHNKLSENIPRCINNFSAMTTMSEHSSNGISYTISMGGFYENAALVMKRKIVKYGTILNIVRSMDLSSNNLSGEIPEEVTSLIILQSLNLSHNHFHRIIPENIGAMGSLESLDFSVNQLVGEIPSSTSRLTFLNYLNLSYKNLKGKIPSSTQLQSFDASSFLGNALWGAPLEENCTVVNETSAKEGGEGQGNKELNGVYVSMELGFVVSFLLTFGFLVIKRR